MTNREERAALSTEYADRAYLRAMERHCVAANVIRSLVSVERDIYGATMDDTVADSCASIALHALAILAERAGMANGDSEPAANDEGRRHGIRNFLRIIQRNVAQLAPIGGAPVGDDQ